MRVQDESKREPELQQRDGLGDAPPGPRQLASIDAALCAAARCFTDLANSLGAGARQVSRTFAVHAGASLHGLAQRDCFVHQRTKTVDGRDVLDQVTLHFRLAGNQGLELDSYADHATNRLCNYLRAYGLRYELRPLRNARGVTLKTTVNLLPDIPASVTAWADRQAGTVRLKLRNVGAIGDAEYCYDPAELDAALLDEFSRLMLGEPNAFSLLGRHQEMLLLRIVACPAPVAASGIRHDSPARN